MTFRFWQGAIQYIHVNIDDGSGIMPTEPQDFTSKNRENPKIEHKHSGQGWRAAVERYLFH
jgi:hypothetical protein